jgi:hypothetical protein
MIKLIMVHKMNEVRFDLGEPVFSSASQRGYIANVGQKLRQFAKASLNPIVFAACGGVLFGSGQIIQAGNLLQREYCSQPGVTQMVGVFCDMYSIAKPICICAAILAVAVGTKILHSELSKKND